MASQNRKCIENVHMYQPQCFTKKITIIEKSIIIFIDGQYYNNYLWIIKENNIS